MRDLSNNLRTISERGTPVGSARLRERVAVELAGGGLTPRRWNLPGPVLAALVAVIAVIAFGGILLLFQTDDGSVASTPEATDPPVVSNTAVSTTAVSTTEAPGSTEATTTATVVSVTPVELEMTWVQAPAQQAFGLNDGILKVIEGGPGLIAVGVVEDAVGYTDGAVWVSADGLDWEKVGDPEVFVGVTNQFGSNRIQVIQDVAAGPGGYVAVGWADSGTGDVDPPIWFSPDGFEWERVTPHGEMVEDLAFASVVVDGTGFVAIGTEVWRSPDGRTWTRIDQQGFEDIDVSPGEPGSAITTDSGLVFAANDNLEGNFVAWADPFVATSSDGVTWTRNSLTSERGMGSGIGLIDERMIVVGYDSSGVTLWASDTGVTWERLGTITGLGYFPTLPVADGDRWVLGGMGNAASVFASNDHGATWHEITTFDRSPEGRFLDTVDQRPPGFRDLIRFGDVFVAVGGTGNGSAPVWIGTWTN